MYDAYIYIYIYIYVYIYPSRSFAGTERADRGASRAPPNFAKLYYISATQVEHSFAGNLAKSKNKRDNRTQQLSTCLPPSRVRRAARLAHPLRDGVRTSVDFTEGPQITYMLPSCALSVLVLPHVAYMLP